MASKVDETAIEPDEEPLCKDDRVVSQVREWATALVVQELPLHFCIHIPLIARVSASRTCSY